MPTSPGRQRDEVPHRSGRGVIQAQGHRQGIGNSNGSHRLLHLYTARIDGRLPRGYARPRQTLDRGLRLLHLVAETPGGLTMTEAAGAPGRRPRGGLPAGRAPCPSTAWSGATAGRLRLGAGVLQLARRAQPLVADAALPALRRLAEAVGATAHLTVADGGEALALAVVEPSWTQFHVAYRTGSRHPLDRGAAGQAILAGRRGD